MIQKQGKVDARMGLDESLADLAMAINDEEKAATKRADRARMQELKEERSVAKLAELVSQFNLRK